MSRISKKNKVHLFILISLLSLGMGIGSSQVSRGEDTSLIRLENVTFQLREIESTPSPLRILEVHVEILNPSHKPVAPPNSIKAVVTPKEIKSSEKNLILPGSEEITLDNPLPPRTRQILIFGFSLPSGSLESITFEVQINPPDGEQKVVTWIRE
jgi:hypothetical protein